MTELDPMEETPCARCGTAITYVPAQDGRGVWVCGRCAHPRQAFALRLGAEQCHMLLTSDELCPNPALWDDEEMLICAEHAAAVCAPTLIAETASFLDAPPPVDY